MTILDKIKLGEVRRFFKAALNNYQRENEESKASLGYRHLQEIKILEGIVSDLDYYPSNSPLYISLGEVGKINKNESALWQGSISSPTLMTIIQFQVMYLAHQRDEYKEEKNDGMFNFCADQIDLFAGTWKALNQYATAYPNNYTTSVVVFEAYLLLN